jgi:hypothetical protein
MVAGDHQQRPSEGSQERRGVLVLDRSPTVREVARDGDQLGLNPLHERLQTLLDGRLLDASGVQVGDVKEAHGQRRTHAIH